MTKIGCNDLAISNDNAQASLAGLIPVTDEDVDELAATMRQKALATDQRILVSERLGGHSITCRQAGVLLQCIKLGLMQRMLTFEVLQGRLSDLPDGLPYVLEPLSGNILRKDVEVGLRDPSQIRSSSTFTNYMTLSNQSSPSECMLPLTPIKSFSSRPTSPTLSNDNRKPGWEVSVNRLRARVNNGDIAPEVKEDLSHLFESLGLGPLRGPRDPNQLLSTLEPSHTDAVLPFESNSMPDVSQDLVLPGAIHRHHRTGSNASQLSEESV